MRRRKSRNEAGNSLSGLCKSIYNSARRANSRGDDMRAREPNLFQFVPISGALTTSYKLSNLNRNTRQIIKYTSRMAGLLKWTKSVVKRAPSPPRQYPNVKFPLINPPGKVEEKKFGIERYYPARIGDVLSSRYQVVGKLGFGNS